jgi:hypothetical protein
MRCFASLLCFCRCWPQAAVRATDGEQLRLCRLLPAVLHPEGSELRELTVAPGAARPLRPAHRLRRA